MKFVWSLALLLLPQVAAAQPRPSPPQVDSIIGVAIPEVYHRIYAEQVQFSSLTPSPAPAVSSTTPASSAAHAWPAAGKRFELSRSDEGLFSATFPDSGSTWSTDYFSRNVPGLAAVSDVQVAPDGRVFVTGYRSKAPYGYETLTVLYDATGAEVWQVSEPELSSPQAMALGDDGAVYVTGTAWSSETTKDIITIKYGQEGSLEWVRRFHGREAEEPAEATALTAYPNGGVVVGGAVPGERGWDDAAVVLRYSTDGDELWHHYYDEDRYVEDDRPLSLFVDSDGAVVVVNRNGTTLKLDADGTEEWVNRESRSMSTDALSAVLDAEGAVYLFGTDGSGIETRKLSADGQEEWQQRLDISFGVAGEILLDETGLVVTALAFGPTLGGIGVATIVLRYSREGEEQWRYFENDPASGEIGVPAALLPHTDSTFYFVGGRMRQGDGADARGSLTVISLFDTTGSRHWSRPYGGNGEVAGLVASADRSPDGTLYLGVGRDTSMVMTAFDASATPLWTAHEAAAPRSLDAVVDVALDSEGNLYLAGRTWSRTGNEDFLVASLTPAGDVRWVERFDGGGMYYEQAISIAVDAENNVYVTGVSLQASEDIVTLSFDAGGALRWASRYDGDLADVPVDIVPDGEGGGYVTGRRRDSDSNRYRIITIRYDADGSVLWEADATGDADGSTVASAMVHLPGGGVAVTGSAEMGADRTDRYFTLNYAADGTERWRAIYQGRRGEAADVAADDLGRIYVAGSTDLNDEMTTVAYDLDGRELWAATHVTGYLYTFGRRIATGPDGVHITGTRTLAYDEAGVSRWVQDRPAFSVASDIAIDRRGRTYVVGLDIDAVRQRVGLEVLDPAGERIFSRWQTQRGAGPGDVAGALPDAALEPYSDPVIAMSEAGDVYVVNNVAPLTKLGAFTVTRYSHEQFPVASDKTDAPRSASHLHRPYPNPFDGEVTITYDLAHASEVSLEVFDLLGRRIGRLQTGWATAGRHSVRWDGAGFAGGVYIVRLTAGGVTQERSLVLAR